MNPLSILTSTTGPIVSTTSSTVVVTPVISPRLLSLKYPIGDTLQFVTDLDPPVRHHEISGVGLLQLSETVDGGTACDTDQKERQSGPCGLIRMVSSGKSKHYIIDSPHLKHMEYCVEKSPENGFADVFLFVVQQNARSFLILRSCCVTVLCANVCLPHFLIKFTALKKIPVRTLCRYTAVLYDKDLICVRNG